jgi:DNA-binding SARP family transcriptional activator
VSGGTDYSSLIIIASRAATTLRICVLGHTEIEGPEGVERLYQQPRLLLLLSYIVLAPGRGFLRRDQIAAAFWPDQPEDRARSSLRSGLYQLRGLLGADIMQSRGDDIAADATRVSCDAHEFTAALKNDQLARALELYRGPLLEGVTPHSAELQHWLDEQRETHRSAAADAAWQLAERYESAASDLTSATRWARRAAKLAGSDERRIRRVMTLLDRAGDAAGGVAVYEEFTRYLARELQMEPSEETSQLARAMRERSAQP